jgi:hypothetical protein
VISGAHEPPTEGLQRGSPAARFSDRADSSKAQSNLGTFESTWESSIAFFTVDRKKTGATKPPRSRKSKRPRAPDRQRPGPGQRVRRTHRRISRWRRRPSDRRRRQSPRALLDRPSCRETELDRAVKAMRARPRRPRLRQARLMICAHRLKRPDKARWAEAAARPHRSSGLGPRRRFRGRPPQSPPSGNLAALRHHARLDRFPSSDPALRPQILGRRSGTQTHLWRHHPRTTSRWAISWTGP